MISASICIFDASVQRRLGALLRTFSLAPWGVKPNTVGPVAELCWTPDCAALAVGWQRRGISLWSLYGCRLMCTVAQLSPGKTELASRGVSSLVASYFFHWLVFLVRC